MFLILVSVLAAAHAYTFGRWLIENGNRTGGFVVHAIAAVCAALPVYRYLSAP